MIKSRWAGHVAHNRDEKLILFGHQKDLNVERWVTLNLIF